MQEKSEILMYNPYNYLYCIEVWLLEIGLGLQDYVTL